MVMEPGTCRQVVRAAGPAVSTWCRSSPESRRWYARPLTLLLSARLTLLTLARGLASTRGSRRAARTGRRARSVTHARGRATATASASAALASPRSNEEAALRTVDEYASSGSTSLLSLLFSFRVSQDLWGADC